jgi:hypothetical protein
MTVTSILKTSTLAESIKVEPNAADKLICLEVFEDGDNKKYMKHLMTLQQLMATKGVEEKLLLTTRELAEKNKILKALHKSHTGETHEAKKFHLLEISEAESQVIEIQSLTKVAADAAYDLSHQFVRGEAPIQWDRIVKDMHEKDLWTGINGVKTKGLRSWNWVSFKDCIELHKLTVFTFDAAEKQASYMMSSQDDHSPAHHAYGGPQWIPYIPAHIEGQRNGGGFYQEG